MLTAYEIFFGVRVISKKKKKNPIEVALKNYLNVASKIEQILSFELLERTHFQENFC